MGADVVSSIGSDKPSAGRHVAMYIGSLCLGGAEHVMVNLAEALYARGWRVTFVTTYLAEEEYEVPHGLWRRIPESEAPEQVDPAADPAPDRSGDRKLVRALTLEEKPVLVERIPWREQPGTGPEETGSGSAGNGIGRIFSGIASREVSGRLQGFIRRKKRLEEIWGDIKPDVILSFIGKNNLMALWTVRRLKIPVVVSFI